MTTTIAHRLYADHRPSKRIDYGSLRVIRKRQRDKQKQRARAESGTWVVGRFILDGSTVKLEAIARTPAHSIEPHRPLSDNFHTLYRWNTRQAARQWLLRNPDPRCQPVNLQTLRGHQPETSPGGRIAAATTNHRGCHPGNDPIDIPGQMTIEEITE